MIGIMEYPSGPSADTSEEYRINENRLRGVNWKSAFNTIHSSSQHLTLQVEDFNAHPRYIYAMAPEGTMSADTSTSHLASDIVTENALWLLKYPDKTDRFLRQLRERTMNADHSTPSLNAMAYFA